MNIKDRLNQAYKSTDKSEKPASNSSAIGQRAQGVPVKTMPKKDETSKAKAKKIELPDSFIKTGRPGIEKAAKFLLLLGQNEAANVIKHLKPDEIEQLSAAISGINRIDTAEANEILTEFGWLAKTQGSMLEGGPEIAETMLTTAFGPDKAKAVLKKAAQKSYKPFSFLNELKTEDLIAILKDETPQVIAMILSYIEPKLASKIISGLNDSLRVDVVKRIAKLDHSSSDVIEQVELVLKSKIEKKVEKSDTAIKLDGASILADILRHVDNNLEDSLLSGIDEADPNLSTNIRDRLFTLDDIARVSNRDIQKALRSMSEKELALLLKGKSQFFKDKILSNVSQSKRSSILDEYELMGAVNRQDVDKSTKLFVDYFKTLWERGDIILDGDEDLID